MLGEIAYKIVGIRFGGIEVPAQATILAAYIEFTADKTDSSAASLLFHGEATDDAAPFAEPNGDISRRTLTTASVTWPEIPAWEISHETHQTPDLSPILQEIVDRSGWSSGNAAAFLIAGTGRRTAVAYEGDPARAPRLVVTYTVPLLPPTPSNGLIRFAVIGRREGLPDAVLREIDTSIRVSQDNTGMCLCLAINYGGRTEIVDAIRTLARQARDGLIDPDSIGEADVSNALYTAGMPDPDLLIRTAGEMRVSNYLLWQISYAEIWVTETLWPDFRRRHLLEAVLAYQKRDRRYGGLKTAPVLSR